MSQYFALHGATTEVLRRKFEEETKLKRQTFCNALVCAKAKQWIVGLGQQGVPNILNPNGCWMEALREPVHPAYQRHSNSAIELQQSNSAGPNQTSVGQLWKNEGNDEVDSIVELASEAIRHANKS
jgi:hypothetical protein